MWRRPVATVLVRVWVVWAILQVMVVEVVEAMPPPGAFLDLDKEWALFKQIHQKVYGSNDTELHRRSVWEANLRMIIEHNLHADRGLYTFRLGMNHLGDMTREEIVGTLNGFRPDYPQPPASPPRAPAPTPGPSSASDGLPLSVDWRAKGYVTPVKDQGRCGSCWAFSSTGALEGQHYRKTGQLLSLSEQNLIDCSFSQGNKGCGGGTITAAFTYVLNNKGVDTQRSYPYQAQNEKCRFRPSYVGATTTADEGYVVVSPPGSERALQRSVAYVGPVSVAVDASLSTFHFYGSGVYYDQSCHGGAGYLDHALLVVGYGRSAVRGEEYWLVKNSWGRTWGQDGYILMARNRGNACGIASSASYPTA